MQISKEELIEIVQMVENTFAKGQRKPYRRAHTLIIPKQEEPNFEVLGLNKAESVSAVSGFDREEDEGPNYVE